MDNTPVELIHGRIHLIAWLRTQFAVSSSLGRGQNVFGYAIADFVIGLVSTFSTSGILDYSLSNWAYFFLLRTIGRSRRG
jgi:hypothetical protein